MNRIIVRPPKVSLNDFIGDFNYLPSLIRQAKHEPMPTMYDVKQLAALYGILPFGLFEKHFLFALFYNLILFRIRKSS